MGLSRKIGANEQAWKEGEQQTVGFLKSEMRVTAEDSKRTFWAEVSVVSDTVPLLVLSLIIRLCRSDTMHISFRV